MRKVTFNDLLNMSIEEEKIGIDNRMFYHWKFFDDEYSHRIDSTCLEQDARVKVKFIKRALKQKQNLFKKQTASEKIKS